MKKRALSLLLALTMVLAVLPVGAMAASGEWVTAYQLYDVKGNKISEEKFDSFQYYYNSETGELNGPIAVKQGGKWGYMNEAGKMVLPLTAQYEEARGFDNGVAAVKQGGKWGLIDLTGKTVVEPAYDKMNGFNGYGHAVVGKGTVTREDDGWEMFEGKYGLIDRTGKVIIPVEYRSVDLFAITEEGSVFYSAQDETGSVRVINQNGKTLLAGYDQVSVMSNGLVQLTKLGEDYSRSCGVADDTGRIILPVEYSSIEVLDDTYMKVARKGEEKIVWGVPYRSDIYGIADMTGKLVVPVEYDSIQRLTDTLFCATKENAETGKKEAYLLHNGKVLTQADSVQELGDGLVCTKKADAETNTVRYTVWNSAGKEILSGTDAPSYQGDGIVTAGRISVGTPGGGTTYYNRYYDENGKELLAAEGYHLVGYSEGLFRVYPNEGRAESGCYFMDKSGKTAFACDKSTLLIRLFQGGLAAIQVPVTVDRTTYHLWGYVDRTGKMVIPATYHEVKDFENGLAKVKSGTGTSAFWGVINTQGKEVVPQNYSEGSITFLSADGLTGSLIQVVESDRTYTLYNADGEKLMGGGTAKYSVQRVDTADETVLFQIDAGSRKLFVDANGKQILNIECDYVDCDNGYLQAGKTVDGKSQSALYTLGGKEVVPFGKYTYATVSGGNHIEVRAENLVGAVNFDGTPAVPAKYDSINFTGEVYIATLWGGDGEGDRTAVYSKEGKELIALGDHTVAAAGPLFGVGTRTWVDRTAPTAVETTQTVNVDGKDVTFYTYALVNENGGLTNYAKLRDVAAILNGTKGQFAVGWNGAINLETGKPYTMAGGELEKTFEGDQPYVLGATSVNVNGSPADLRAITLVDENGGNYNYFELRELGKALGFNVGWSREKGVFIETDKPYTDAD